MAEETKKPETKEIKTEIKKAGKETRKEEPGKEYIIPLRKKFKKTVSYHRAPKAIRAIKEFLVRHMKIYDRNLKKIKIEKSLNDFIWMRGIKNPPAKIKIRAFFDGDFVRADLAELTEKLRFKKEKLEKRERKAESAAPKEKKPEIPEEAKEKREGEKAEEKEKKAAVVEAGQELEKISAKKMKFETKVSKQPKRQRRMALQK